MIHSHEDLFVGSVSVLLGLFLIAVSAAHWEWYYSLRSARFVERFLGRTGTRLFHALLGCALTALGVAIARGFRLISGS